MTVYQHLILLIFSRFVSEKSSTSTIRTSSKLYWGKQFFKSKALILKYLLLDITVINFFSPETISEVVVDSLRDDYMESIHSYDENEWPPSQPKTVVNVTLIHHEDRSHRTRVN